MHGPIWLSSTILPIVLIGIGIFFLILTIKNRNQIKDVTNVGGLQILDTSYYN